MMLFVATQGPRGWKNEICECMRMLLLQVMGPSDIQEMTENLKFLGLVPGSNFVFDAAMHDFKWQMAPPALLIF